MKYFLAIDIGASSGRHVIAWRDGGEIKTEEVFRFSTGFCSKDGHLINDIDALTRNVLEGVREAFSRYPHIECLAIDTWGVDYVLMKGDTAVMPVFAYRDARTEDVIDEVHALIPFEELYARTGTQFQNFNTIYQLYADKLAGRLKDVTDFLMLPEYLSYVLTGVKKKEYTNATTTGLINAETKEFDQEIINELGLPITLFVGKLSTAGEEVGELSTTIQKQVNGNCKVLLCASHDTASAVEGIPMEQNALYLSSGTWSLLGVKSEQAITCDSARIANYSNEGGVGYIRFQKNIMGMWIVNELKKEICPELSFGEIVELARKSNCATCLNVNDNKFFAPTSMKKAFDSELQTTNLSIGDYFNIAFNSLAQGYADAIRELSAITGKVYTKLYIVGGGAKNIYLKDLTAEKCGVQVIALPIEATALGNLKIQMEVLE